MASMHANLKIGSGSLAPFISRWNVATTHHYIRHLLAHSFLGEPELIFSRGTHAGLKLRHLLRQSFRGERIVGALAAVVAIAAAVAALLAASVVAACLLRCTALASSPQLTE